MSRVAQQWDRLKGRRAMSVLVTTLGVVGMVGCAGPGNGGWSTQYNWRESGYGATCKTQVMFYAPPGASVTVRGPERTHQVAPETAYDNRLERTPDEESIFNLWPGRYEFKYTAIEGVPDVSIYGELEIKCLQSPMAKKFQRLANVPIALPSEHYRKVEVVGNETYPYRGENFRTAIDENDLMRLRAGDIVEKVFVVADLKAAEKARLALEQEIAVTDRKLEYAEARFRDAYLNFRVDVTDPSARFWGKDKKFIAWQEEQTLLQQKLDKLQDKLARVQALLKADTVTTRQGMLLVATNEVIKGYDDPDEAADKIGEVLLVMRLGGRHMHWGEPARALAGLQPAE